MPSRLNAPRVITLAVFASLVLAGCGGSEPDAGPPQDVSGGAASLVDVSSAEELRARFNRDAGVPRLLLLLSPT